MLKGGKFYTKLGLPESAVTTSGVLADIMYRTDLDWTEVYTASGWEPIADYLVGDVTVIDASVTVDGLQGLPISSITPAEGQYLYNDGSQWIPSGIQTDLIQERTPNVGVYFPDKMGIGIPPDPSVGLYISYDVDTTADYWGMRTVFTKTTGATDYNDNFVGFSNLMVLDQVGGEVGYMYGFFGSATVNNGTVGAVGNVRNVWGMNGISDINGGTVTGSAVGGQMQTNVQGGTISGDATGAYGFANLDSGTVTGDVYGVRSNVDIQAGMTAVGGNVYGVHVSIDDDQGVVGTVYGLYFSLLTGVDYAVYSSGTQPSYHAGIFDIAGGIRTKTSDYNTSIPPQNLELDSAFGTPETLGDGFIGILDDAGAGSNVYICVVKNGWWWYLGPMTGAVDP